MSVESALLVVSLGANVALLAVLATVEEERRDLLTDLVGALKRGDLDVEDLRRARGVTEVETAVGREEDRR